ncbi:unnamed protein product [Rotaria socialis]|uniref:UBC core domain-containing protein n=2 Tax=Rotaria socialis TaxID=392032 RepID=A0A820XFZ0_9BILA|nr:unnamed protein product [Rotaria socialis]CAF3300663.1 unnamed protein product [Rotaria socialis]CAF3367792.1 unnamed protein product [Rotaria socialis]CAF4356339.1 unnamed protein product [Rotaria socialis]CAF4529289.1 unnamed protein product [Rotaria socialis]
MSNSNTSQRRLFKDLQKIQSEELPGINATPVDNDMRVWNALIDGPSDTCYEDGLFTLRMEFTDTYPLTPPNVRFTCKMFHPNVYADGSICLDILQRNWSPTYDVCAILTSIRSLLNDPNPNSPANNEAAKLFLENRRLYESKVRKLVEESIMADQIINDLKLTDDNDDDEKKKSIDKSPSAAAAASNNNNNNNNNNDSNNNNTNQEAQATAASASSSNP